MDAESGCSVQVRKDGKVLRTLGRRGRHLMLFVTLLDETFWIVKPLDDSS